MSMYAVLAYVLAASLLVVLIFVLHEVIGAVLCARGYYRWHPELVPPDRFLVRVGLWRCR